MADYIERKSNLITEIAEVEGERIIRFIGSTESPDRSDDIVSVDGWEVENYLKNPVFLWAHDYSVPPIGKCVSLVVDKQNRRLLFDVYFPTIEELSDINNPSEHAKMVDMVFKMYKTKLLSATSVGFKSKKYKVRADQDDKPTYERGLLFEGQELLELSAVPVPANPEALAIIRGMGDNSITKSFDGYLNKSNENVTTESEVKKMELENRIKALEAKIAVIEATEKELDDVEAKAGAKVSKATKAALKSCQDKLKEIDETLEQLASDGSLTDGNDSSDGSELPARKSETDNQDKGELVITLETPLEDLENLRF
jgi:uncharacterized protein